MSTLSPEFSIDTRPSGLAKIFKLGLSCALPAVFQLQAVGISGSLQLPFMDRAIIAGESIGVEGSSRSVLQEAQKTSVLGPIEASGFIRIEQVVPILELKFSVRTSAGTFEVILPRLMPNSQ